MEGKEVGAALGLNDPNSPGGQSLISRNFTYKIQTTVGTTGDGIFDGLSWLSSMIDSNKKQRAATSPTS